MVWTGRVLLIADHCDTEHMRILAISAHMDHLPAIILLLAPFGSPGIIARKREGVVANCAQGHDMPETMNFCGECGAARTNSPGSTEALGIATPPSNRAALSRRPRVLAGLGVVGVLALVAIGVVGYVAKGNSNQAGTAKAALTFSVSGTATLTSGSDISAGMNGDCQGYGGFSDITTGGQVLISDESEGQLQ